MSDSPPRSDGLPSGWQKWPIEARLKYLATQRAASWQLQANPGQRPPLGPERVWYAQGGRGSGKTRSGAERLGELVLTHPAGDWAAIGPTFGDARDTLVEHRKSGLLKVLGAAVVKWNRSIGELKLANGGWIFCDGADDGALRIQGKGLRGAWCVAGDQRVRLRRGEVPIRDVRVGDEAWTRRGWRRVAAHTLTRRGAPLLAVETADGQRLRLTAEHPVWVERRGWVAAGALKIGDKLRVWKSSPDPLLGSNGAASAGIATARATTRIEQASSCTPSPGRGGTGDGFPTATYSTIATAIARIMRRGTSSRCRGRRTWPSTLASLTPPRLRPRSAAPRRRHGPSESRASEFAPTAARSFARRANALDSASLRVGASSPVSNIAPSGRADVFDLTVEGEHEFVAEGILVKNCDEIGLWRKISAWNESLIFAVREAPALIIATGTPKGNKGIVKLLRSEPEGRVAFTFPNLEDNRENLEPKIVEEWERLYAGTRLARQELRGEVLEDVPGALWRWNMIEETRLDDPLAEIRGVQGNRCVVAIDPAITATDESDETGILVAQTLPKTSDLVARLAAEHPGSRPDVDHVAVLDDRSGTYTPEQWAAYAIGAYHDLKADRIVAEANQGGEMVRSVIHSIDPNVPVSLVWASKGKQPRAEPVAALYEQGRVHHLGAFAELETEQTTWVPGESSPNRMDALVWAIFDLMLRDPRHTTFAPEADRAPTPSITGDLMDKVF